MIRVALVDDQMLVRQGLGSLIALTPDIRVVAEASDGEAALALDRAAIDIFLLDVRMPKKSGLEVLRAWRAELSKIPKTIVLTTFDDDEVFLEVVRLGAAGYLLKDVSFEQLTLALRTVAAGGTLILPALTARAAAGRRAETVETLVEPLTRREVQILRLIGGGYNNREIARALGAAEGTIKNHVSNILSKLGVRDRTRALLKALDLGLL